MCLITLAWQTDPRYPLVVAANRDEQFARASTAAHFWPEAQQLLAGQDLEAGGTWLGITRNGRFAAITNYRDPARLRADAPSRGKLVADFLLGDEAPGEYLQRIQNDAAACNGFNLLVADTDELWWHSNVNGEIRKLPPGIHAVSNHLLDTPWPKLVKAKAAFAAALPGLPEQKPLFDLLQDDQQHPDEVLPSTGVSLERERQLSAIFVKTPGYGTRNSTLLMRERSGAIHFEEQTWLEYGLPGERVSIQT